MKPIEILVRSTVAAISLAMLASLALAVAGRLPAPFPLEWMEGAELEHVARVARGEPLYAPPSASFIPFVYTPLAYVLMVPFVWAAGLSLPAARAASVLATLATLGAVGTLAARSTSQHRRWAAILAAGLYAAGFAYGGAFYDLCRVDAVAIALCAAGVAILGQGTVRWRTLAGFGLLVLAVLAKQQTILVLIAVTAVSFRERPLRMPALVAWAALALFVAVASALTDGWFWFYTVAIPRGHSVYPAVALGYLLFDLALPLPLLVCAFVWALRRRQIRAHEVAALGAIASSALARAHQGGFDNVLLVGYALFVPCAAGALADWVMSPGHSAVRRLAALAATITQFALLWTPPGAFQPSSHDGLAWTRARRELARCAAGRPGAALDHAGLGDAPIAHTMAISDVVTGAPRADRRRTAALMEADLRGGRLGALAVGKSTLPGMDFALEDRYVLCVALSALPMQTGHDPGPVRIFRSKRDH